MPNAKTLPHRFAVSAGVYSYAYLSKLHSLNSSHTPSMLGKIEPAVIPINLRSRIASSRSLAGMSIASTGASGQVFIIAVTIDSFLSTSQSPNPNESEEFLL